MSNRGYAGYYNGVYLRSSYEYAYALLLDFYKITWKYEEQVFDIDGKKYKPDFFIYDNLGRLKKIVEVKSNIKKEIEKAKSDLALLEEKYKIKTEVVVYSDLKSMYEEIGISLYKTINEWIKSENTTISKVTTADLNPHFGMKHSETTKEVIGNFTKERWNDEETKQKMLEGLRKGTEKAKEKLTGVIKVEREIRKCLRCTREFKVIITSKKRFCSIQCSSADLSKKGTEKYLSNRKKVHDDTRDFIVNWCEKNKDVLINTPYNKISPNLAELLAHLEEKFDIKDFRSISKIMLGEDLGRKRLLDYLKQI